MATFDRAAGKNLEQRISGLLARRTGTAESDWYCVFKARYGMRVAFDVIRELRGEGFVVTQLLTCCTAVDPILAAGLVPRYCDISVDTASLDPLALELDDRVRAVVLQHTYGIVDEATSRELAARAHAAGALVIEDCAHCVGRMALDEEGRPLADISIHSFGIEKVLDTLYGGAVWVNPTSPFADVAAEVASRLGSLPVAGFHLALLARMNRFQLRVFGHLPRPVARALRRGLSSAGLFDPAVSDEERRGGLSYRPLRPSRFVCEKVLVALEGLGRVEDSRAAVTAVYRSELPGLPGVAIPAAAVSGDVQPLLKFPLLVEGTELADRVVEAVCSAGYFTSAWYRPELTPGVLDEAAYHVPANRAGLAANDRFVACVATLPTNIDVAGARRVCEAVRSVVSS